MQWIGQCDACLHLQLYELACCNHMQCTIDAGAYGCTEEKREVKGKNREEVMQDLCLVCHGAAVVEEVIVDL